ncbi:MAG: hypothetical protein M3Y91_06885 [Actinomycetota bacterium]|nr:hypothetical protein [Actinomycetota bacterium]
MSDPSATVTPGSVTLGFSEPDPEPAPHAAARPEHLGQENDVESDAKAQRAASALAKIQARRTEGPDVLHIDKIVPRREPIPGAAVTYVRFRPLEPDVIADAWERRQKRRKDGTRSKAWRTMASAEALVEACIGVYGVVVDGDGTEMRVSYMPGDPFGEWTKFDTDLAKAIGSSATAGAGVCRALYETDGDIMTVAGELAEWSGTVAPDEDEAFTGS